MGYEWNLILEKGNERFVAVCAIERSLYRQKNNPMHILQWILDHLLRKMQLEDRKESETRTSMLK